MERVQSTLGRAPDQAVTDGGYVSRETILALDEKNIERIAPVPDPQPTGRAQWVRRGIRPEFFPETFSYDAAKNACVCPAGRELPFEHGETKTGVTHHYYRASYDGCQRWAFKSQCCPENQKKGRSVVRSEEHPEVLSFKKRMETPAAMDAIILAADRKLKNGPIKAVLTVIKGKWR